MPGALLPSQDITNMTGVWFSIGLPPSAAVKIGYVDDPHRIVNMRFSDVVVLCILLCIWTALAYGVVRLRSWIRQRPTILGTVLQAGITLAYGFLLLVSVAGLIQVVWTVLLCRADMATLAVAFVIAKWGLPPLCVFGAVGVLTLIWVDSWSFTGWYRASHGVAVFLAVAGIAILSAFARFKWQIMDESARFAREEIRRSRSTDANHTGQQTPAGDVLKAASEE